MWEYARLETKLTYMDMEGVTAFEGGIYLLDECGNYESLSPERFEVTQYIGLKDNKGEEIYDADIFQYTEHEGYLLKSFRARITWSDLNCCFGYFGYSEVLDKQSYTAFNEHDELEYDVLPYCEIVGNIYQNPELLEQ